MLSELYAEVNRPDLPKSRLSGDPLWTAGFQVGQYLATRDALKRFEHGRSAEATMLQHSIKPFVKDVDHGVIFPGELTLLHVPLIYSPASSSYCIETNS